MGKTSVRRPASLCAPWLTCRPDIHLTAILEHPNISSLKPEASQVLLQQALHDHPSKMLETSSNSYYVRRKPSSYPPKYLQLVPRHR